MKRGGMTIQYNENVIREYRATGLSIEHMGSIIFILFALYKERQDLLDLFDDCNREKRTLLLYAHLVTRGLLSPTKETESSIYKLSEKGNALVKLLESHFDKEESVPEVMEKKAEEEAVKVTSPTPPTSGAEEWIDEWFELWPHGKINGRYLRTNKPECLAKMTWFVNQFGYDKDVIINATRRYLEEQERSENGHKFTKSSSYFISKQIGFSRADRASELATWCERVGDTNESKTDLGAYDKLI